MTARCQGTGRYRRRQGGFTLLELLIAVAIFALVSAMAYTGLRQVLRANERLEAERATWRSLTLCFLRMEDDVAQARPRTVRDVTGVVLPALIGQSTDTRALAAPSLELTRGGVFVPPEPAPVEGQAPDPNAKKPAPRSDMQRVGYRLEEHKLLRLVWPDLDQSPQSKAQETVVLTDVEEFQVRFFAGQAGWVDAWPMTGADGLPQNPGELPRGVQVRLVLKGRGEFKRLFLIHE